MGCVQSTPAAGEVRRTSNDKAKPHKVVPPPSSIVALATPEPNTALRAPPPQRPPPPHVHHAPRVDDRNLVKAVRAEKMGDLDIRSDSYMEGTGHAKPSVHEEAHFKWSKLKTIVVGSEHDKFVLALRKTRRDKEGFASLDGAPLPHDGTPISVMQGLPVGWEAIPVPGTDRQIYVNHNNGTHTTTRPPTSPGLPIGWEQRVDYHGKVFYVNTKDKTTQLLPPRHAIDTLNGNTPATSHASALSSPDHDDPALLHANLEAKRSKALKIETTKSIADAALMKKSIQGGMPSPTTSKDAVFLGTIEGPREGDRPPVGISGRHDTGMKRLGMVAKHKSIKIHVTKANVKVQVKKTLDDIAGKGGKYVDADFASPQDVPDKIWLRPEHLRYNGKAFIKAGTLPKLFNDPEPEDAKQGTIGDCWFISSLSVLASYNEGHLLRDIFPGQSAYHPSGAFVVRLCVAGQWKNILIDDQMPCLEGGAWNDKNRCLSFCGTVRQQMWAPFIEKAYAKVCRGYLKLIAGQGGEALSTLTGWPCQVFDLDDDDELADSLWEAVVTATAAGSLMIISTNDTNEATGLVPNHAYSLSRVVKIDAFGDKHRLFMIHNPHGHGEWNGDWSDGDKSRWTPENIALAYPDGDIVDADDGTFWMEWDDIVTNFDDVVICKVDHTFHESRVPFTMSNKYDGAAESFELEVEHDCVVNLSFTQLAKRALPDNEAMIDLSFILMQMPDDVTGTGVIHPALCKYVESASLSLKGSTMIDGFPLKKGRYLVVPFSFWNKREGGIKKEVTFVALSKEPLHIRQHALNIGQARAALRSYVVDGGQSTSSKNFPVTTYFRSEGHGLLLWEENKSTYDAVEFNLDFPLFEGMWSTRGTNNIKDVVPPGHGKLVVVALSIGLVNDEDARYSWKYTWGSFRKDKNLVPVDMYADMHCPIVNEYVHKDPRITDPSFNQERKYKHASGLLTLTNTYDGRHPVLKFTIAHETECAIVMCNPAHNEVLASENPELWHAGADKAALDYSFVVLKVGADTDEHFASAPINVTGEAETECKLAPGDYAIVPFNFSNKHAGAPPVAVTVEVISTKTVKFTKAATDHLGYKAALRQYVAGHGEVAVNDTDASVVRTTRHDGHATMVWVDNSGDGSMKHILQFASDDNICNSRGGEKKLDDIVQPHEGKLIVMAQPMDVRLGYDVSHGTGWVVVQRPIKRNDDGPESIHCPISLVNVPRV